MAWETASCTEDGGMRSVARGIRDRIKLGVLRSFGRLRRLSVGPYGVAILTRTENGLLLVPSGDVMLGRRLSFQGRYDSELLGFLLGKCEAASEVLFVGAHVGALAIPLAKKVNRVVAVEANPRTFELLRMNVVLNGLQNMEIHNFAAGDRNGEVAFLTSELNSGGSGIEIGERGQEAGIYDEPVRIDVRMKKLDDAFPRTHFDLIVMDIEGSEALALRGMSTLVGRSRGLLIEVFEHHLRRVARVSNEEFLSLVGTQFDEAFLLPEKPRVGEAVSSGPYPKSAFPEMMLKCCKQGMSNVMFLKSPSQSL
jgi:FkbM family methyltransferase